MVQVITTEPATPTLILEILEKHGVNFMFTPTSNLTAMTECLQKHQYDLSKLIVMATSGAHLHEHLKAAMRPYFAGMFLSIYGMTELASSITLDMKGVPNSTGQLMPGIQGKVRLIF